MEKQYSEQFFTSFLETLQKVCQDTLFFNKFVEVSGYVCVEIDNMKKERYVLSELLQSSGNVVSESFCTKVSKTVPTVVPQNQRRIYLQNNNSLNRQSSDCMIQINPHKCSLTSQEMYVEDTRFQPRRSSTESLVSVSDEDTRYSNMSNESCSGRSDFKRPRVNVGNINQFNIPRQTPKPPSINAGNTKCSTLCRNNTVDESQERQVCSAQSKQIGQLQLTSDESIPLSSLSDCSIIPVQLFKHSEPKRANDDSFSDTYQEDATSKSIISVEEEVIDLDLFEVDSDIQVDEDSCQDAADEMASFRPEYDAQHKRSQLRPGTQVMVRNSVNQFKRFIMDKYNHDIDLLTCPPEKLNQFLLEYFKEARKVDGGELRAKSLKCVQERLMLFLKEGDYPYSLIKGKEFLSSREYLKKKLLEEGRVVSQIHSPLDDSDINRLFLTCQLGSASLESLTNTMWFLNTKYFNVKGPAFHLDLKWGNIVLRTNEYGEEFLERPLTDAVSLKVFPNSEDPSRCYVNFYKQFKALRPKVALDDGYAFYLKHNRCFGQEVGYLSEPMVYHQLATIWRKMVDASGIPVNKKIM